MRLTICVVVACALFGSGDEVFARQSASEALAKEVRDVMQRLKLDSLAARELDSQERFVAALYVPPQLLVVSARYAAPALLNERLLNGDYRNIYLQLQGAGEQKDKLFVQDLGADGLHAVPDKDRPFDIIYESMTTRTAFDGQWQAQHSTESRYREKFAATDRRYARLLEALLARAKAATRQE